MTTLALVVGLAGLAYIYGGYGLILHASARIAGRDARLPPGYEKGAWPAVTVFVGAYNEGPKISRRVQNLSELDYPRDRLEIMVVSDGSVDDTVPAAEAAGARFPDLDVQVLALPENQGRHAVQNATARSAKGEILVTTDADSAFAPDFLRRLIAHFSDPTVGVAGGEKRYPVSETDVARSIGIYQRVEYWTRRGEDRWGLLAKTDGPCTAYRKSIWDEHEEFEDVDHSTVALAWAVGLVARHEPAAHCFELPSQSVRQEVRARARMTRKGILTIRKRWPLGRVLTHPVKTAALYSHRYVRFASPVFSILVLVGGLACAWGLLGVIPSVSLALGGIAMAAVPRGVPLLGGLAGHVRSFAVANWGFLLGIMGFLRGDRTGRYAPTHPAG